jgi:hypothetical protein
MNPEMTRKIDAVLDRVKEPESGLSIAQLGLVDKLRYNPTRKRLYIYTSTIRHNRKQCCTIIQGLLLSGTLNSLIAEFQKEFPDLAVEVV